MRHTSLGIVVPQPLFHHPFLTKTHCRHHSQLVSFHTSCPEHIYHLSPHCRGTVFNVCYPSRFIRFIRLINIAINRGKHHAAQYQSREHQRQCKDIAKQSLKANKQYRRHNQNGCDGDCQKVKDTSYKRPFGIQEDSCSQGKCAEKSWTILDHKKINVSINPRFPRPRAPG